MPEHLKLTLYSRTGCHLCMDMEAGLEILNETYSFSLEIIDIDDDLVFKKQYNADVPVLKYKNEIICAHFLDKNKFELLFSS